MSSITSTSASTTNDLPNTTDMSNIDPRCSLYYQNASGIIIKDYQGIPENLIVNFGAWLALLILFTFIRRIGDYGRFGLLKNDEERWGARFFGQIQLDDEFGSSSDTEHPKGTNSQESQNNGSRNRLSSVAESVTNMSQQDYPHSSEYRDRHVLSWLVHMFKLKDKHISEKCGKDALYYLVFQRYLLIYMLIVTLASVSILLPINLNGTALYTSKIFGSTTIVNVLPNSSVLWVHLVLSWIFLLMGLFFMRQFSKCMEYTEADYVSRTVLITNYPTTMCKTEYVYKHFAEAYPELKVTDVQFAYDVNKLNKLARRKRAMHIGKITSEKLYEQTNQRPQMHPFHCGSLVELCCCCCTRCFKDNQTQVTDSINFYTKNENELRAKIAENREKVIKKPWGIVFVTFQNKNMAKEFLKHYRMGLLAPVLKSTFHKRNSCTSCYLCQDFPRDSTIQNEIRSDKWFVKYAPSPSNIKWENISKIGVSWWARCVLINLILIILMIFFTTPSILIEKLSPWSSILNLNTLQQILPGYLVEFLPSLLLRLLAALLPVLVAYTALAELHWTRSAENRSMMVKTFTLLLFMVLILPTLGLTSINAVFEWLNTKNDDIIKWRCVSDNGAFFLKYVTTCSLIGTALDLLRLPELFLYVVRLLWSRSSAERLAVRMQAAFEFDYGVQYAWMLTVFTITLCYSVVCPLISPFGLIYLVLKHLVDRYNIYFAYVSTKVDKNIHKSAVTFSIASFIMLQFCILFFIGIRNKGNINTNAMTTVQIIIILCSCIIFFGRLFFGVFKRFTPFSINLKGLSGKPNDNDNQQTAYDYDRDDDDNYNDAFDDSDTTPTTRASNNFDINNNNVRNGFESAIIKAISEQPKMINSETTPENQINRVNLRNPRSASRKKESPFIPNILRPSSPDIFIKLKSNDEQESSHTTETDTDSPLSTNHVNLASHPSVVSQSQIDIQLNQPTPSDETNTKPTTSTNNLNYGALDGISKNIFQDDNKDHD